MKKIFLSLSFLIVCNSIVQAQLINNIRRIENYNHRTALKLEGNSLKVDIDNQVHKFVLKMSKGELDFSNNEALKFLEVLQFSQANKDSLSKSYNEKPELKGFTLPIQIVKRTQELNNEMKFIQAEEVSMTESNLDADEQTSDYVSSSNQTQDSFILKNWIWLVGLLSSFVIGFVVSKIIFSKKAIATNQKTKVESLNDFNKRNEFNPSVEASNISDSKLVLSLQENISNFQSQIYKLENELIKRKEFDELYFTNVSSKIITPFWEAIGSGNQKEMVEFSLIGMAHFSALTRYRKGIDQPMDIYNLRYLTSQNLPENATKIISSQTPIDTIPNNILFLIKFLKSQESSGLDATSFSGFTINQIA